VSGTGGVLEQDVRMSLHDCGIVRSGGVAMAVAMAMRALQAWRVLGLEDYVSKICRAQSHVKAAELPARMHTKSCGRAGGLPNAICPPAAMGGEA